MPTDPTVTTVTKRMALFAIGRLHENAARWADSGECRDVETAKTVDLDAADLRTFIRAAPDALATAPAADASDSPAAPTDADLVSMYGLVVAAAENSGRERAERAEDVAEKLRIVQGMDRAALHAAELALSGACHRGAQAEMERDSALARAAAAERERDEARDNALSEAERRVLTLPERIATTEAERGFLEVAASGIRFLRDGKWSNK